MSDNKLVKTVTDAATLTGLAAGIKVISSSQYPLLFLFKTVILMCTSGKIKFCCCCYQYAVEMRHLVSKKRAPA